MKNCSHCGHPLNEEEKCSCSNVLPEECTCEGTVRDDALESVGGDEVKNEETAGEEIADVADNPDSMEE